MLEFSLKQLEVFVCDGSQPGRSTGRREAALPAAREILDHSRILEGETRRPAKIRCSSDKNITCFA